MTHIPEGYIKLGQCKKRRASVQKSKRKVFVLFRVGEETRFPIPADEYRWSDRGFSHDIIAYKFAD